MKILHSLAIFALVLFFSSCNEEDLSLEKVSEEKIEVITNSNISHYTKTQYAFTDEIPFTNTEGGKTTVEFLLEKVEFFPKSEHTKMLNEILEEKFHTVVSEAKDAYADAETVIEDLGYGSIAIAYEMKVSAPYIDESIASLSTNTYWYTGGAHGMTTIDSNTYNLSTGKKITLSDIFVDVDNLELKQLMQDKLLNIRNKEHYFDFNTIRLHENFIIHNNGLQFTFNQYDIASYAAGITEINFTFDEIRYFLREDSPIGHLF